MCLTAVATALAGAAGSRLLAPKAPKGPAYTDPAAEKARADADAANAANSRLAAKNRSRATSSLLAVRTADSAVPALGAPAGKAQLGA